MIGFFPDPYPDELLCSVFARYQQIAQYPTELMAVQDLFGVVQGNFVVDLPNRLKYLLDNLPQGHHYSFESLIYQNTLFPFYSPFLTKERKTRIFEQMAGSHGKGVHTLIGDLASYSGRIKTEKLIISFREKYPDQFLQRLGLDINPQDANTWLSLFFRASSGIQHPFKHLLLLDFLEIHPLNFFQLPEKYRPFGEANWPCLNPVCPDYKQMLISDYHSKLYYYGRKTRITKLIGTFSCPTCQFSYKRFGPDEHFQDRFKFCAIQFYGETWDDTLIKLWKDKSISQKEITKKLGIDSRTLKKQALRLNLPIPRDLRYKKKKQNKIVSVPQKKKSSSTKVNTEKLDSYRTSFLKILKENNGITRQQLKKMFNREYNWLRRNDRLWLEANLPPSKKFNYTDSYKTYWQERDLLIVSQIPDVVAKIKQISEPKPIRITRTLIGRELGCKNTLLTELSKLPKTKKLLDEVIETLEEFNIRRIWWAFDLFNQHKICPTKTQFLLKLNFNNETNTKPLIQKNMSEALQLLEIYK